MSLILRILFVLAGAITALFVVLAGSLWSLRRKT